MLKTLAACIVVSTLGLTSLYVATDGFNVFTLESARRLQALRSPRLVPGRLLEFSDGRVARLADLDAPVLIVDFIYTRCPSFCIALGSVYAQLQRELATEIAQGSVRLVSISFDPKRDGPVELNAYRLRFTREASGWNLARPLIPGELTSWLTSFGVVVIADEWGGYTHNAALHVIGPDRRLVAIHGLDDVTGAVGTTRRLLSADSQ